jgi:ABC-2 type transport system permease protein
MLNNVFLKTLRDQRRSLLFWGIGLIALAVIMSLFYPTISQMESVSNYLEELPEKWREMFGAQADAFDYTTPIGYFSTELYSFMVPLLFMIFGIGFGAGTIAGDEEKGTLDFLIANPVTRQRVVAEKFGVMVVTMLILAFIFWAGLAICIAALNIDLNLLKLAEATIGALMLALVFASLSLLLGCLKGNRGMSIGISCGLAVLTYLLNTLGSIVDWLKDYRFLSPFYHYMEPNTLKNGLDPVHILVLLVLVLIFFVASIPAFTRRDIAV